MRSSWLKLANVMLFVAIVLAILGGPVSLDTNGLPTMQDNFEHQAALFFAMGASIILVLILFGHNFDSDEGEEKIGGGESVDEIFK